MGDGRDWTFVLDEKCGECGEDIRDLDERDLAGQVRATGARWQQLLTSRAADPATWARIAEAAASASPARIAMTTASCCSSE